MLRTKEIGDAGRIEYADRSKDSSFIERASCMISHSGNEAEEKSPQMANEINGCSDGWSAQRLH